MSFDINTNIASLQAQQYLRTNSSFQAKTINEVTSGLRIVSSGDDAAGLAIANGYRSDQAVIGQGVRNANDGLSQLQIADGGISNISQLLDRARTLATQSATGTFTGSRAVLNSEFQSVIGEINRQAQAIGLDQGGAFAKNLSVFIGGGKSNATTAIVNGSVSVDLSKSTVDAKSLGLQGVQAIGVAGTDIGTGSPSTSVSAIVGNAANVATEVNGGFTTFTFQGPGFGNNNPVQVSVNLTGVTDTNTLVAAVNAAIQNAGNGATQAATAFKNAGVSASLNTDATGKTQLTFNSSTAAFQVAAGDQVSQALLGNFQQNAVAVGTDQAATIATNGVAANKTLTLAVDGGTAFDVVLTGVAVSATASKADIVRGLNANTAFSALATASLEGNKLEITSKGNSATSAVTFTTTALSSNLGLASATAASASTGADLSTQVQADSNTAAGATTFGTIGAGTVTFQFEGSGLTAPVSVNLTTTASTTVAQAISALSAQVASNASLKAAGISLTTATAGNALAFTGTSGGAFSVGVTGDVQNLLGAGSFSSGAGNSFDYSSVAAAANFSVAGSNTGVANLEFSINGGSSSTNKVTIDLGAGNAAAATLTSTDSTINNVAVSPNNNTLNLVVNGTGVSVTLNNNAAATKADIAAQITAAFVGASIGATASVVGNAITITTTAKGAGQSVSVQAGTANTALGFATNAAASGTTRNIVDVTNALNTALAANSTLQAAGLTATNDGSKITVTSSNGTFFRTNAYGASTSASVIGTANQNVAATAGVGAGTAVGPFAIVAGSNDKILIKVDGAGAFTTITLQAGLTRTAAQIAADINNSVLAGATASVDSLGHVQITSNTTGVLSKITYDVVGNSTANTILGLTSGAPAGLAVGSAAISGFTITAASNDTLTLNVDGAGPQSVTLTAGVGLSAATVAADIQAKFAALATPVLVTATAVNGTIRIASNKTGLGSSVVTAAATADATLGFTAAASVSGTTADLGFGQAGATFVRGNTATAAPVVAVQVDAGGSNASATLAFAPVAYGTDTQTVSISAIDSTGGTHSLSTLLQNNATSRSGESLDTSINSINTALQQSNDSTLKNIVAVKENTGGTEGIRFLSGSGSFKVSVGTTAQGGGVGSQGTTASSAISGGGSTADISTQAGSLSVVNTLAAAVAALGSAQAVVGRGENQFNYAINLAQSQLTNLASAESQIRDADLASQAANLTKAQILLQAGVAALAQANSAPQAVLALLKG
jgi:flagellin